MFKIITTCILQYSSVGLVLAVLAYHRRSLKPIILGGILFGTFLFDTLMLHLPRLAFLVDLHWNWQGKTIEAMWPLIVVYVFGWLKPQEIGLTLKSNTIRYLTLSILVILITMVFLSFHINANQFVRGNPGAETIIYQLTMPGLGEEMVYRGIFWAIINRYLSQSGIFFKLNIGWPLILTSILFTCSHVVIFHSSTNSIELLWSGLIALPIGIALGLIREKTASIWPCIVFHNAVNGLFVILW